MAQSTILAAGITAATSTDITVAAGASVNVGIFAAAAGTLPSSVKFRIYADSPGSDRYIGELRQTNQTTALAGPGTFRIRRPAYTGTAFGVFLET